VITDCSTLSDESVVNFPAPPIGSVLHVICICKKNMVDQAQSDYLSSIQKRFNSDMTLSPLFSFDFRKIEDLIDALIARHFSPLQRILRCGCLTATVQIHPAIDSSATERLDNEIEVIAFVRPQALANCPVISHHLLVPITGDQDNEEAASLTSLMAQSFKAENMTALCRLGNEWYGLLYFVNTSPPSTTGANLTLHCLAYGNETVPWLGCLASASFVPYTTGTVNDNLNGPGISSKQKPSYAANCTSWLQPYGLQSDVQKLVRYMKKLPDRHVPFYQEVNRVCQYALALGYIDLLDGLAGLLETESASAAPAVQKHCKHIAEIIRSRQFTYGKNIEPPA